MEKATLFQKLLKIRQEIEYLQKTESGNQGAKYVDPAILLKKIRAGMDKHGVLLIPSLCNSKVQSIPMPTKNNAAAMGFIFESEMKFRWINCDGGGVDDFEISWFCTGKHMSDPAMATGSALTYAVRYFLLKFFQIPTAKDEPEYFEQKTREPEIISEKQVSEITDLMNSINNFSEEAFLKWVRKDSVELILAQDYEKVKNALIAKQKQGVAP